MIEITVSLASIDTARRFARMLHTAADAEPHRGQARSWRRAAARLERFANPARSYRPRVRRPRHSEIDEEAVQRVVHGLRPYPVLSRAEARLACYRMTVAGHSTREIAGRVGIARRTVSRWRAEDPLIYEAVDR
ncbi:helix-turn-helix domain-containing protein [Streptomyces shenzhenensis]|uniref:Uncharacterized protein n=1 Tax=Streptomyces shenzhenensis TaxID=943815 RepID=A0A3M0IB69_9ACTN|nr:helix-turn-helix domain-containing protein [Streptomyces shenzhenensis]RMB85598.1 hypothetical protein CTZ28_12460 [Streptomyces shenzhenensis]